MGTNSTASDERHPRGPSPTGRGSNFLTDLTSRDDCADVLHVITALADDLDVHGSPIDYARRRALFGSRETFLDRQRWTRLQKTLRSNPAGTHLHAQRWLFETLTGSTIRLAHPALAPATAADYGYCQRFRWHLLPAEADLLYQRALELLDPHRLDEPARWSPQLPGHLMGELILPGPDPSSITPDQVQRLAPTGAFSIARLAKDLGATTAHARYLLAEHPVDWSPPRFLQTQNTARRALQWRIWYERTACPYRPSPAVHTSAAPPFASPCASKGFPALRAGDHGA